MGDYVRKENSVVVERYRIESITIDRNAKSIIARITHTYTDESNNLQQEALIHSIDDRLGTVIDPSFTFTQESIDALGGLPTGFSMNDPATWSLLTALLPMVEVPTKKYYTILMSNMTLNLFQAIVSHLVTVEIFPSGIDWSMESGL